MTYIDAIKSWNFILLYSVVDTSDTWELYVLASDRDEYDENNDRTYRIKSIGVDAMGFFYKEQFIDYDGSHNPVTTGEVTKHLLYYSSGDFVLNFIPQDTGSPQYGDQTIPDSYASLFTPNDVSVEVIQQHVTATVGYGYDGLGFYRLIFTITTDNGYKFASDDVVITNILQSTSEQVDIEGTPSSQISVDNTILTLYYPVHVNNTSQYYNRGFLTGFIRYCDIYKETLDVTESLVGVSTTAPSTIAHGGNLTATVSLLTGYSFDDISVNVYMGETLVSNAYDEDTHIITVNSVTDDITIVITAKKLHTFRFYSSTGGTLFATYSGISIDEIEITLNGTLRTLTINGTNIYTWNVAFLENETLSGLSTFINPSRSEIPVGISIDSNYITDTDFYECTIITGAIPDTFTMNLYRNSAENIRVDKTSWISLVTTLTGTLRSSCTVVNPVIRIEYSTMIDFNYVFIPQFKRYYFVTEINSVSKNVWDIALSVDVLMSFKEQIYRQYGLIERNQYTYNPDIEDTNRSYEKENEFEYVELTTGVFDVTRSGTTLGGTDYSARFVLTVVDKGE